MYEYYMIETRVMALCPLPSTLQNIFLSFFRSHRFFSGNAMFLQIYRLTFCRYQLPCNLHTQLHIHWPTLLVGIVFMKVLTCHIHTCSPLSFSVSWPLIQRRLWLVTSQFFVAYRVTDNRQFYVHFTCAAKRSPNVCGEWKSSSTISVQCNVITSVCHGATVLQFQQNILPLRRRQKICEIQNIIDWDGVSFFYWNEEEWHDNIYIG